MGKIYTLAQQKATMKWRLKNKEKWAEYMVHINHNYRHKDMDANRARQNSYYHYKKDCDYVSVAKVFRHILL